MSTNDVPGAVEAHQDSLHMGCWAEHEDGSLILVEGVENGKVVFEIFDLSRPGDPVGYRDAMPEADFKRQFSFPPVGTSKVRWTWHDKTPFDWSRIMRLGERPRPRAVSAEQELSAAERIAEDLKLRGRHINREDIEDRVERSGAKSPAEIVQRIADAIKSFLE